MSETRKQHDQSDARSSAKVAYLQQEIRQLQDQVKDLQEIVKINKEAVKLAFTSSSSRGASGKGKANLNSNETAATFNEGSSTPDTKSCLALVEQLQEENVYLLEIITKLVDERNLAQSKALLSEQLFEEQQRRESENMKESAKKAQKLQALIEEKDKKLLEMEGSKKHLEIDRGVSRLIEVANVSENNMKFFDEIDMLLKANVKITNELERSKKENEGLFAQNMELAEEIRSLSANANMLSSPTKLPDQAMMISPSMPGFLDNMADMNDEDPENSQMLSPLPDKITMKPATQPKSVIPKLDLSKAFKIQEMTVNKGAQPQADGQQAQQVNQASTKLNELIKGLEKQVSELKQSLKEETFNNEVNSEHIRRLKMELAAALAANETLIQANRQYETKWKRIRSSLEFYKSFYFRFIQNFTKGHAVKGKNAADNMFHSSKNLKEKYNIELNSHPKQINFDQNDQPSILDVDSERPNFDFAFRPAQTKLQFIAQLDFEQSKYFVLELAKSLQTELNFHKLNSSEYANPMAALRSRKSAHKRSLSSPSHLILMEREENMLIYGGQFNQEDRRSFHTGNQELYFKDVIGKNKPMNSLVEFHQGDPGEELIKEELTGGRFKNSSNRPEITKK